VNWNECGNKPTQNKDVLKRIFGIKKDEITGGWIKLSREEPHNLCSSPNITMIKSRRM
jgi:hypothetical protein